MVYGDETLVPTCI